ncbi:MAG TPA: VWA domain-containing protein [Candidatus Angelobacter sp.]
MLKRYEQLWRVGLLGLCVVLGSGLALPQSTPGNSPQTPPANTPSQKDEGIPDAPSTVQPAKPVPEPQQEAPEQQGPPPPSSQAEPAPRSDQQSPAPQNQTGANPGAQPPINIRTVPEGGATKDTDSAQERPYTIPTFVNQVMVPVTVKDESGRLVNGLTSKDFTVLENGKKETLNFFTSDPFALSAAVIIDLGMKDVDVQRVNHTFSALEGAFSQFDELSIYSYSNTVSQLSGWGAVGQQLEARLEELQSARGQDNGPPVTSGPLGPNGPMINGMPANPGAPTVYTPVQEAHVMNDAILKAAIDLSQRDPTRRKIIFIISDGREYRSDASYRDVLRVLLKNNVIVYAIGVGGSAIPGYNKLAKIHIPRLGYTDILPKYVSATGGGQVFEELTRNGIEDAYAQALGDARNQYTLGYRLGGAPSGAYRSIEVQVDRPSCKSSIRPCVNVYARDGYYPNPAR